MLSFSSLTLLTYSIFNAKIPTISSLIAQKQFKKAKHLFAKSSLSSLLLTLISCTLLFLGIIFVKVNNFAIAEKFTDTRTSLFVFGVSMLSFVLYCVANYVRSFKKEGFLIPAILSSLIVPFVFTNSLSRNLSDAMMTYFILQVLINVPFVIFNLKKYLFRFW